MFLQSASVLMFTCALQLALPSKEWPTLAEEAHPTALATFRTTFRTSGSPAAAQSHGSGDISLGVCLTGRLARRLRQLLEPDGIVATCLRCVRVGKLDAKLEGDPWRCHWPQVEQLRFRAPQKIVLVAVRMITLQRAPGALRSPADDGIALLPWHRLGLAMHRVEARLAKEAIAVLRSTQHGKKTHVRYR